MTEKIQCSAGYSARLIGKFAEIHEEIRGTDRLFGFAEDNLTRAISSLQNVHAEQDRLARTINRLLKVRPAWFDKPEWGIVDRKLPELNARVEAFSMNLNSPLPVLDDDWFMGLMDEGHALVQLMRSMRRRIRKKTRMLGSEAN